MNLVAYQANRFSPLFWLFIACSVLIHAYFLWVWYPARFGTPAGNAEKTVLPVRIQFKQPEPPKNTIPEKPKTAVKPQISKPPQPTQKKMEPPKPKEVVEKIKTPPKKPPKIQKSDAYIPPPPPTPPEPVQKQEPIAETESITQPVKHIPPMQPTVKPTTSPIIEDAKPVKLKKEEPRYAKGVEDNYKSLLISWIRRFKQYPSYMRKNGVEGTSVLRFTVNQYGEITNANISKSSGYSALDRATLRMLQRALPLPAAPEGFSRTNLTVTVPVEYNLD